jgi:hypothetical protein
MEALLTIVYCKVPATAPVKVPSRMGVVKSSVSFQYRNKFQVAFVPNLSTLVAIVKISPATKVLAVTATLISLTAVSEFCADVAFAEKADLYLF